MTNFARAIVATFLLIVLAVGYRVSFAQQPQVRLPSSWGRVAGFSGDTILLEAEDGMLRAVRMGQQNTAAVFWVMPRQQ